MVSISVIYFPRFFSCIKANTVQLKAIIATIDIYVSIFPPMLIIPFLIDNDYHLNIR
jgi:hypothetical protein